jgi:hypothetical protein
MIFKVCLIFYFLNFLLEIYVMLQHWRNPHENARHRDPTVNWMMKNSYQKCSKSTGNQRHRKMRTFCFCIETKYRPWSEQLPKNGHIPQLGSTFWGQLLRGSCCGGCYGGRKWFWDWRSHTIDALPQTVCCSNRRLPQSESTIFGS